jgi:hypothetical protein
VEFDPETYEWRIQCLLEFIKKQNLQQKKEDLWLENQKSKFPTVPKRKIKTKNQKRKEQLINLKKQIPQMGNVNKFFNF